MRIVIAGPKCSGKSTVGKLVAERLDIPFVETDHEIERLYSESTGNSLSCREIYAREGEKRFRELEQQAVKSAATRDWCLICTGGSTLLNPESRRLLRCNSIMVFLSAAPEVLWDRVCALGKPDFLKGNEGEQLYSQRVQQMLDVIMPYCDAVVDTTNLSIEETVDAAAQRIFEELATRATAPNTIGEVIRLTTYGESHGPAMGAVLDGVPPGIELSAEDIQADLDRRRPGQSSITTPRSEADRVEILSGVFEGKTTGAPIGLLIRNSDQKSAHYDGVKDLFRPGHADFTYWRKYGIRDYRGGGRSSGRETSARVAGGAIAKKMLKNRGVTITAYAIEIAGIKAQSVDYSEIERNAARCPDPEAAKLMEAAIVEAKSCGDSVGGIVQLVVHGVPVGLGDPVFCKLDAMLGRAILSLGAVKGIEFGAGFRAPRLRGSQSNDPMRGERFVSNNAGGILGGISTGNDIVMQIAVKPTPSISLAQESCNIEGEDVAVVVEGRHDPCIVPRVIPVMECMAALVLLDAWETQNRLRPGWNE